MNALYWRRQFKDTCNVVAVSPGLIPGTGIARHTQIPLSTDMHDAKSIPEGARSLLAAFFRDDFPSRPQSDLLDELGRIVVE